MAKANNATFTALSKGNCHLQSVLHASLNARWIVLRGSLDVLHKLVDL